MQAKRNSNESRIQVRLNPKKERDQLICEYLEKLPDRAKSNFVLDAIYNAIKQNKIEDAIKKTIEKTLIDLLTDQQIEFRQSPTLITQNTESFEKNSIQEEVSNDDEIDIDEDILNDFSDFL